MITDEQQDAIRQLEDDGEGVRIAPDSRGHDFLILDGWDDVRTVESILDPKADIGPDSMESGAIDRAFGGNWGFSDEYAVCDDCGTVIRTSPDSYSWKPDFWLEAEEGYHCGDCVREDPDDYIEHLVDNPDEANTILSDDELRSRGFAKVNEDAYENGWYDRQDEPKDILAKAMGKEPNAEFLFSISSNAEFSTQFDLWRRD